ncbi:hypothetical protein H4R33_000195 [Dimargaris cristalligena]|uniref:Methyltransferase-domain-containing protein n=1 Tax=Dimargaris cristalligena TaxID=215637 RepID=A0A4P9ZU42_9FUNG|nr:hypothetical protein H4R33_000195 [Dimargaris cristalligena]RKP36100.1 hypothetical protein BJ085DRAFT_35827 [Dimargaris cristalligena]|eukprot:RKP36100.1 hypothetical protein BJ085DRAFT_35827 [Dimargaris cristalligena]
MSQPTESLADNPWGLPKRLYTFPPLPIETYDDLTLPSPEHPEESQGSQPTADHASTFNKPTVPPTRADYFSRPLVLAVALALVRHVAQQATLSLIHSPVPGSPAPPDDSSPPPPLLACWVPWLTKVAGRGTDILAELDAQPQGDGTEIMPPLPTLKETDDYGEGDGNRIELERIAWRDQLTQGVEQAAAAIANMCGKTASGPVTKTFTVGQFRIHIQEPSFVEVDLGYKTWGSAFGLSESIVRGDIPVRDRSVLELGSGTGLVGITCGLLGARAVYLTDYHPAIVNNLAHNIRLNHLTDCGAVGACLDWSWLADFNRATADHRHYQQPLQCSTGLWDRLPSFDTIVAADVVYEMDHAKWLPRLLAYLLFSSPTLSPPLSHQSTLPNKSFYLITPLRHTHSVEMTTWVAEMESQGLICVASRDLPNPGYDDAASSYRLQQWQVDLSLLG